MSDIRFNRWLHQSGTGGVYQDSAGKVGIGTDDPKIASGGIHIYAGASGQTGTNSAGLVIEDSDDAEMALLCPSTNVGRIKFGDENIANKAQVRYDHTDGSMQFTLSGNKERLRITSGGLVGIGSTQPTEALDVNGNISIVPNSGIRGVYIGNGTTSGIGQLVSDQDRQDADQNILSLQAKWANTQVASIFFQTGSDTVNKDEGYIEFKTRNGESGGIPTRMTLSKEGNLGIGTDNPVENLDVSGNTNTTIRINNYDDSEATLFFHNTGSNDRKIVTANADMIFYGGASAANEHVRIKSDGKVGIGSDNPTELLDVAGNTTVASNGRVNIYRPTATSTNTAFQINSDVGATDSTQFIIKAGGSVGIGSDAPSQKLNVAGNIMLEGSDQYMYLTNVGTGNAGMYVRGRDSTNELRSHSTGIFTWEVTGSEQMRLTGSTGNLQIANGNLVFSTSGTGIDFSATGDSSGTTNSELLDDYEEGTWTPSYDTNTTSSTAISYNNQTGGSYIKVGRAVYICGRIRTNTSQSLDGTGSIIITGLPFAISSGFDGSVNTQDCSAVFSVQQVDGWSDSPLVLLGQEGFSKLDLYKGGTLASPVALADFDTSGSGINRMRFSGFYFTDS